MQRIGPQKFWQQKTLAEMNQAEWESLCDGCGKCCLHKLEDEDTDEVYYTNVACRYLDEDTCRCTHYAERKALVPNCVSLSINNLEVLEWLPGTCAYKIIAEGGDLPSWHHLVSGSSATIHTAKISVRGRVQREDAVAEEELEEHIVYWVD